MRTNSTRTFGRPQILGACAPDLAFDALGAEARLGALLPFNDVVQETDEENIEVYVVDAVALLGLVDKPSLDPIVEEVSRRLDRVLAAVASA